MKNYNSDSSYIHVPTMYLIVMHSCVFVLMFISLLNSESMSRVKRLEMKAWNYLESRCPVTLKDENNYNQTPSLPLITTSLISYSHHLSLLLTAPSGRDGSRRQSGGDKSNRVLPKSCYAQEVWRKYKSAAPSSRSSF